MVKLLGIARRVDSDKSVGGLFSLSVLHRCVSRSDSVSSVEAVTVLQVMASYTIDFPQ